MTLENSRIVLTPIDPATARRIIAREEREDDNWHPEYPFADELGPLRGLARSERAETPFTMYAIRLPLTRTAVGGLGFFGPPDESGLVEFGYGLIPAVRGKGLATAAVMLALEMPEVGRNTRPRGHGSREPRVPPSS